MIEERKIAAWNTPISDEPDHPTHSADVMKDRFDANANQLKEQFNALVDELLAVTAAAQIGSEPIAGLEGNTVRAQIAAIMTGKVASASIKALRFGTDGFLEATTNGTLWARVPTWGEVVMEPGGEAKNLTVAFTETAEVESITTGDSLGMLFGKIKKWLSGIKDAAWRDIGTTSETVAAGNHDHGSINSDGKIGTIADLPVFTGAGGAVGTKSVVNAKIALDIDTRNFEYGGREIPFTWAQIQAKITAGDFSGIRNGDYKDIVIGGTYYDAASASNKTLTSQTVRMIANINPYIGCGDTVIGNHIDFISRDCLSPMFKYNATNTNSGSFIGSALYTTLNGASGIVTLLPSDVATVIIQKRASTETKTGTTASGRAWNNVGKLWIPTEPEVWGRLIWCEAYGNAQSIHYHIFKNSTRYLIKGAGNGGARCNWWTASSKVGSSVDFCAVSSTGVANYTTPDDVTIGVPLCFRVG